MSAQLYCNKNTNAITHLLQHKFSCNIVAFKNIFITFELCNITS